jgi:nicotinamidase-related amidase
VPDAPPKNAPAEAAQPPKNGSTEAAQPPKNQSLHGSAPDTCPVALLLIDVINDFDFEGGEEQLEQALPMARALKSLKARAKAAGIPVVYVNDNYGRWQSNFERLVEHAGREGSRGRPIVQMLRPEHDDYFVLKPKNSGFYSTTLSILLEYLGTRTLIVTGLATDNCVLFTASDGYMRDYFILVPEDCVSARSPERSARALEQMRDVLKADTTPSERLDLAALARGDTSRAA